MYAPHRVYADENHIYDGDRPAFVLRFIGFLCQTIAVGVGLEGLGILVARIVISILRVATRFAGQNQSACGTETWQRVLTRVHLPEFP